MTSSEESYYYPNRMGRIVLVAMNDIIGNHGVNATLNLAGVPDLVNNYPPNNLKLGFRFENLAAIQETMDDMFGLRGGRLLAMRTGRETFKYALKDFMPVLGIADLAFRPLHLGIKLKIGLGVFAETFNKFTDQVVRLEEEIDRHLWIIERCPVCWQRKSTNPCCHLAVGLLKESLNWVSNGREFRVEEIQCIAAGDSACVIAIYKQPIL
ncbi:MAG TPA: 4-vinyl reductase [Patescibacteria group bacterium]|nr:4-vinyl reductase [Patescibacteria group bacterium]